MPPCSQAFGGEEYCERALYQEVKAVRRRDGRDSTKSRQSEETLKRSCEEGAEAGSSSLPRTQRRRFGMDGCGRQFASERIQQGQCEAFQTRMVTTPYEARSERTSAIRHTNKREGSAASKGPAAHCHSLPRCPPASSNTRRTSHNEGLHAGYGFDKLCKSNIFFLPQVRHPQVWSQRALCSFQPSPRTRTADRTAPVQTEPEANQSHRPLEAYTNVPSLGHLKTST